MTDFPAPGHTLEVTATRMAHGGEGIATGPDGRVIFVRGAYPGDTAEVTITEVKKRFARATVSEVTNAGPFHGEQRCPAAAAGAGCCDFGDLRPDKELELKEDILLGQLSRVVDQEDLPPLQAEELAPDRGWRTRVRLGVDKHGRAGTRKLGSHELVTDEACSQLAQGLVDGLVGKDAQTFEPGSEIIAVLDSTGARHVVETRTPPRGERVENYTRVLEGDGTVIERADGVDFRFPPTAFWQAHVAAPDAYARRVREWTTDLDLGKHPVAWDLYGGVGLFAPALGDALGPEGRVISVDFSTAATSHTQPGLSAYQIERINKRVERAVGNLPAPDVVVLDPPRTGAGADVIRLTARSSPQVVIHVGCDPATFARDVKTWKEAGYEISDLTLINAFPGTHHFEVMARLTPAIATN